MAITYCLTSRTPFSSVSYRAAPQHWAQDLPLKTSTVTEALAFAQCAVERPFQNRETLSAKPSSKALIFISMHSPVGWMFYDQIWVATNGNFNHKPPTLPVLQRAGQASQCRPLHSGRIPLTVLDKTAIDYCPWGFSRPTSRLSAFKINKEQLEWNWALWHYINAMLKTRIHITGLETIS